MVNGWNLLTSEAAIRRKVREIRQGVTEDDDPLEVEVAFFDHLYEPRTLGVEVEEEVEEALRVNVICIPTGLHLPPEGTAQTKWHPTGEMVIARVDDPAGGGQSEVSVPEMRQVPNLVSAEEAQVMAGPTKPSRVDAPSAMDRGGYVRDVEEPVGPNNVTAEEVAMARAEARAMREGNVVPFKRWGLTHKEVRAILNEPD